MKDDLDEKVLLQNIREYFSSQLFQKHRDSALSKHTKLKSYNVNPIIVKYLVRVLGVKYNPIGVAKALYFPRVLGTSINTSFGTNSQKMFVKLGLANGSLIKGMDIEFQDRVDKRQKWCQLKAGPNTINSGDVKPLMDEFSTVSNLARTNTIEMNNGDLMLGVIYGEKKQLSQHYQIINRTYPVYVGQEFWHRITGFQNFYLNLITELESLINDLDSQNFFEEGYSRLAKEIEASDFFDF